MSRKEILDWLKLNEEYSNILTRQNEFLLGLLDQDLATAELLRDLGMRMHACRLYRKLTNCDIKESFEWSKTE